MRTRTLQGLGVSPGLGVGCAVCLETGEGEVFRLPLHSEAAVEEEVERLRRAVESAREELSELVGQARKQLGPDLGAIFEAHLLLLGDDAVLGHIVQHIRKRRVNAEWATHRTEQDLVRRFESLEEAHLTERADDVRDVTRHLLRALRGVAARQLSDIDEDVVLIAHDLTPSEAVRLGRQRVVGFALETGGPTSHTAIISRSLHIPLVAGLEGIVDQAHDDAPVIVDGNEGSVVLHPTTAQLRKVRTRLRAEKKKVEVLAGTRELEAVTEDGVRIELMANVDLPEEIAEATAFGARGVGLYRSEFLFIERSPALPTEDEQVELFRQLLSAAKPHPAIIRTFDLGGRKLARDVMDTQEENPVLGLRGVRLTLGRPDIFGVQVRAMLRAAAYGELWVMLPMVSAAEEITKFRRFVKRTAKQLESEGVTHRADFKLGIMIEVPSAAMIADRLARTVDFFSIGSNDLIQYSMAVDRNNEHVSYLYQPLHPAILRMVRFVVESARAAGIDVSICGEMAAVPQYTELLLGLGLRRLSLSPRAIPDVKERIRSLAVAQAEALVERCLEASTASRVGALLAGSRPAV